MQIVTRAKAWGYDTVAVSGGEPLLYPHLLEVLGHAHRIGLNTSLVTNGFFVTPERAAELARFDTTVAISIDGLGPNHNRLRGSPQAFNKVRAAIDVLAAAGSRFGLIHAVTSTNWQDIPDIADFALGVGATFLQLHPMVETGRAQSDGPYGQAMTEDEGLKFYLLYRVLAAEVAPALSVHADVLPRAAAVAEYDRMKSALATLDTPLAHGMPILVVEPDGALIPFVFGIDRAAQLGDLRSEMAAKPNESFEANARRRGIATITAAMARLDRNTELGVVSIFDNIGRFDGRESQDSVEDHVLISAA